MRSRVPFSVGVVALTIAACLVNAPLADAQQQIASAEDLNRLSIEELARIRVTSVSRTEEPLNRAPAAVFVITSETIERSGATTLPEILRLAPNLHVARLDANTYAISARGFNHSSGTANKLLVLIDGRAIYSPLFSGTFWDAQKTFIPDIDRIEVISGPGGTLWGGNAVNGVINIITKESIRTRGAMVDAQAGTLDRRLAGRLGTSAGVDGSVRVYGFGMRHGAMERPSGASAEDSWNHLQGGFRSDWQKAEQRLTLQGDAYRGTGIGRPGVRSSGELSGANLSATWQRDLSPGSTLQVQTYVDTTRRILTSGIEAQLEQYSVETQWNVTPRARHAVVLGGGLRLTEDEFTRGPGTVLLEPAGRQLSFASLFVQDTFTVSERLKITAGTKLEHNTYTGLEVMPDVRLAWSLSDNAMLWTSAARAVRIPSRFDTDLVNPGILNGGPDFRSESLIAYEAGYRGIIGSKASVSLSLFHHDYDDLRTVEASGPTVFPLVIRNGMRGHTSGVEAWGNLAVTDRWRVSAGVATLSKSLRLTPGSRDIFGVEFAGNDPSHHWSIRSSFDLPREVEIDIGLRRVSRLESPRVDAYSEVDARIGWSPVSSVEMAIVGHNLLNESHVEFINSSIGPVLVPRSIAMTLRWTR
ncbi:MAG TPA: TonB-dependent receptor [Thermoanaerobaculia bacterium]